MPFFHRTIMAIVLLLSFALPASGQPADVAYYDFVNNLTGEKNTQRWVAQDLQEDDDDLVYYSVQKSVLDTPAPQKVAVIEDPYFRQVDLAEGFYVKTFLQRHPLKMRYGGHSFGHIEIRKTEGDAVLVAWPVFFSIERYTVLHHLRLVIYKKDSILTIEKFYSKSSYHFPEMETEREWSITEGKVTHFASYRKR